MNSLLDRMSRRRSAVTAFLIVTPLIATAVNAEGDWGGALSVNISQDDNARKTANNPIEERQDEAAARLFADYTGVWYQLEADYTASYLNYSKDSQDDRNQLEGSASVFLGKPNGWVSLDFGNERRSVYNAPENAPITENLDDRSVWYAEPALIARLGSANTVTLSGRAEQVTYRFDERRDSEPVSARLTYQREISSTSFVQVYGGQRIVEYPNGNSDDYETLFASVGWNSRLRLLSYELRLGYNEATFDDDDDTYAAPSGFFRMDYDAAVNQFGIELSQDITDTSSGNAFQEELPDAPQADGVGIDQIERQRARLTWTSQALCALCETTLGYRYQFDDYRRQNRDGVTEAFNISFRYRFSETLSSDIRYERSEVEYDDPAVFGYQADRIDFQVEKRLGAKFSGRLFYSYEQRDASEDYDQNVIGFGIRYDLK